MRICFNVIILVLCFVGTFAHAGVVEQHRLDSPHLKRNLIQLDTKRRVQIYLPDGYHESTQAYPVIYYLSSAEQALDAQAIAMFDQAIASGVLPPCLVVTADFTLPVGFNFWGNNDVVGHWLDFVHRDLVAFIDNKYRSIRTAEARVISGHFLGGYAAIKLAMLYPKTFASVYALHPVGTDVGERPYLFRPDWKEIHAAKSFADLKSPYSAPFVSMAQAHLPNPKRPPFYADFMVAQHGDELVPDISAIRGLRQAFHLADLFMEYAENMKQLKGIGFDWGRNDQTFGHVTGARRYSVLLENFGIEHEAMEHLGNGWDYEFAPGSRVQQWMLPFIGRQLTR